MRRSTLSSGPPRAGVALIVVVSLLALFAVVGLSFVIYAESEAQSSSMFREAHVLVTENADEAPEMLLNQALGQFIYGVKDDETGIYSAIRGHDVARSIYS